MAAVRARARAVLARRPLHVQLSALVQRGRPLPIAGRRDLSGGLPGTDGRAAAARPTPQPRARPSRDDRFAGDDARAGARFLARADRAIRARPHAVAGAKARFDRVPARRHPSARRGNPARGRHRQAPRGALPARAEHRDAARDGLRLRRADARQRVQPSGDPRRRLDLLLPVLGRRGPASVDAGARRAGRRPGAETAADAPCALDLRGPRRADDGDRPADPRDRHGHGPSDRRLGASCSRSS